MAFSGFRVTITDSNDVVVNDYVNPIAGQALAQMQDVFYNGDMPTDLTIRWRAIQFDEVPDA